MRISILLGSSLLCLGACSLSNAQSPEERVYKTSVRPHWSVDGASLWYKNLLPDGESEFIFVDCKSGVRRLAFDHQRLATALTQAGVPATALDLPLEDLRLEGVSAELGAEKLRFRCGGQDWLFDQRDQTLTPSELPTKKTSTSDLQASRPRPQTGGEETFLTFRNQTEHPVQLLWSADADQETSYGDLAAGESRRQHTYSGHIWHVLGSSGRSLGYVQATDNEAEVVIDNQSASPISGERRREGRRRRTEGRVSSPDGKWSAEIREHNIVLFDVETQDEKVLTEDGSPQHTYGKLSWSPDSRILAAFKIRPVPAKPVVRINSALDDNEFRASYVEQGYALPGDEFTEYAPRIFDVQQDAELVPEVDPIDFGEPSIRWYGDHNLTYQQVDRGHQRFRLVEIDALTGASRNIIDERSESFIWTAHREAMGVPKITWLADDTEILFVSEMDGYRHLYLVDVASGTIRNSVTTGDYVVTAIEEIDELQRQVWFQAAGYHPQQDPYLNHYFRVNLDGTDLVCLTDGNGTHTLQFSPDRSYAVDSYSRVDLPPIHELRQMSDGKKICELERADTSHSSWTPPTVFVAKGRDGQTDIWGIIEFPKDFNPSQQFPILEDIYAGPHGYFTPKRFSSRPRYGQLTEMGFVVVKLDGMGTAGRSKAFHDVCWHNLKDAGFPDRIAWIRAAAESLFRHGYLSGWHLWNLRRWSKRRGCTTLPCRLLPGRICGLWVP